MKNKCKKKKGAISIIYVILIFIAAIIILGFLSIMKKTLSINEIQGILDMAGLISLRSGVDETMWRIEKIKINESIVRNEFTKIVNENIKTGEEGLLRDFKIVELNVYSPNHPGLKKIGIPNGERDQYYIESVAEAVYKSEPIIDLIAFDFIQYFDFFNTNKNAIKMASGNIGDGNVEVIVRSVVRLVLR